MNKVTNLGIVVISFDGYSDLWDNFFRIFKKFWPDCPYTKYLVNNYKNYSFEDWKIINTGNEINWFNRVKIAMEEIKEDYIILLLEDYFLGQKVNNEMIEIAIDYMKKNNIYYYRLDTNKKLEGKIDEYPYVSPIYSDKPYGISLAASIWRRSDFVNFLYKINGDSAWSFENYFVQLEKQSVKSEPIPNVCKDIRNILDIHNGVLQGKWMNETVNYYKKVGFDLELGCRGVMTWKETKVHAAKQITSRRLPKKMKKWLKYILKKFNVKFITD